MYRKKSLNEKLIIKRLLSANLKNIKIIKVLTINFWKKKIYKTTFNKKNNNTHLKKLKAIISYIKNKEIWLYNINLIKKNKKYCNKLLFTIKTNKIVLLNNNKYHKQTPNNLNFIIKLKLKKQFQSHLFINIKTTSHIKILYLIIWQNNISNKNYLVKNRYKQTIL